MSDWALDDTTLDAGLVKILANSRNRTADGATVAGIKAGWMEVLLGRAWLTDAVYERAVYEWLATMKGEQAFVPSPAEMLAICEYAKDELARQAERELPRLPPPRRREGDEIDPDDPSSCTPEERKRWAGEDAWIRQWAARLQTAAPAVLECLSPEGRAYFEAADRNNLAVVDRLGLSPAARRAKERRRAVAKERALGQMREAAQLMRARLARIAAYRGANGLPTSLGVPEAVWKDAEAAG